MSNTRPGWLTDPCPAWCQEDHADQWHPEDRAHASEHVVVPVITIDRGFAGGGELVREVAATELAVVVYRQVGAREVWVTVANDRQRIEVTRESAARLRDALDAALARTARE
ncbi:hypothetical protein LOK55_04365 [Microbacterium sp. F2E]|uniref:DUF6907 domain-containing protein n=1 Tax=Microbacterium sp. F2E TaxID=2895284 RepID=UPI001E5EE6B7|nr:hypothetical protein [Microbacterium sp. F2E]MCC9053542.1 hypothetical protein [Microbacterium sp. F2E]